MLSITFVRVVATLVAVTLAALGAYGAWEFAKKLEGGITYVVLAAPVIAAAAALIPAIAETTWKSGAKVKGALWWIVLIPAAATVYFAVAERVHYAKAGLAAEQSAYASAAARARQTLDAKVEEAKAAKAKADETKGWRRCGPTCQGIRATAERLEREEADARRALLVAEKAVRAEAPLKAHPALFPAAMYLVEFMAFWTALTGPMPKLRWPKRRTKKVEQKTVGKRRRAPRRRNVPAASKKAPTVVKPANDNVLPFPPAA